MNKLDLDYLALLRDILKNGVAKGDRTGTGTISVFGRQIRHKMSDGFPLLTTKKMPFKTIVTELLWFLRGDTNIKYLVDNDCHIWDGDAYKNWFENGRTDFERFADPFFISDNALGEETFHQITMKFFIERIKMDVEFAKKWGELGPIYGSQWRKWKTYPSSYEKLIRVKQEGARYEESRMATFANNDEIVWIDQITNLINELKTNPDSRRLMVNAWNVGELDQMVLPPCHYGFQVYTRELTERERIEMIQPFGMDALVPEVREKWMKENNVPTRAISLMWNQRSVDTPLGLPFNIASYALLLMMFADEVNMVPDELIGNLGDCHIYLNQIDGVKEQIKREAYPLPKVSVRDGIYCSSVNDFILENYQSHPKINYPLSN